MDKQTTDQGSCVNTTITPPPGLKPVPQCCLCCFVFNVCCACVCACAVGLLFFWLYLSGYTIPQLRNAAGDTLVCFVQTPGRPLSPEAAAKCTNLMFAAIKAMLVYPPIVFIIGKHY